jgi:hypothetical protein
MPETDEWTPETFDKYLAVEVLLPHGLGKGDGAKPSGRRYACRGCAFEPHLGYSAVQELLGRYRVFFGRENGSSKR